jgi:nucleotide-binding universal stress UspA family protein
MTGSRAAVVVAVGRRRPPGEAVDWAAAEAAARGAPLRIVHVCASSFAVDPYGLVPVGDGPLADRALGEESLRAALGRATSVAPGLEVSAELRSGAPARVLQELSRGAALLVVRRHGRGTHRPLLGSVSGQVAARAGCPVTLVGRRPEAPGEPIRPRVVVGVDVLRCGPEVLDLAFRAAAQRGVPLVAVHAWGSDVPADLEGVCGAPSVSERRAREELERLLAPWRDRFPDVPLRARVTCGDPAAVLVAASAGASLLVLGPRRRGALLAAFSGAVGSGLVQRVDVPVTVVHPATPVHAPRPATGATRTGREPGRTWPRDRPWN